MPDRVPEPLAVVLEDAGVPELAPEARCGLSVRLESNCLAEQCAGVVDFVPADRKVRGPLEHFQHLQ